MPCHSAGDQRDADQAGQLAWRQTETIESRHIAGQFRIDTITMNTMRDRRSSSARLSCEDHGRDTGRRESDGAISPAT